MAYADGFVIPVPTKNLNAYRKMAEKAGKVWIEHGALDYKECVAEDMTAEGMNSTFPKTLGAKKAETIIFSWILYKNRTDRDRVLKKVMADPRLQAMMDPKSSPFDPKRMLYGGFEVIVDYSVSATPKKRAVKRAAGKSKRARA